MAFGKPKPVERTLRLRIGGEDLDIVWQGSENDLSTLGGISMIWKQGAGGDVERTPSGEFIAVNWSAVSTVRVVG